VAQERVTLANELYNIAEQFLNTIEDRVQVGKTPQTQIARAKVERAAARIEWRKARTDQQIAIKKLASLWAESDPKFERAEGELDSTLRLPAGNELQVVAKTPLIRAWVTKEKQLEIELDLARANKIPDPTIWGGFRHMKDIDDHAFIMGLSVPLPLFDRNQGNIKKAEYRLLQTRKQQQAFSLSLQTRIDEIHSSLQALYDELNILSEDILPETENALNMINQGYLQGKYGFIDVLDSQRVLFRYRNQYLETLKTFHDLIIELDFILGKNSSGYYDHVFKSSTKK
jgi:cobalt-zinc-cadmium efflux system outer membrane protein